MSVHECQSLNQSALDSKQAATIINRNENTQTSLANINASLNQALDELNKKYQSSTQIANSGSILVAILTIGFIGLIIINDLVRALAFFVNSLVVSNYTPEAASDLPVIGVYYIFNIGLVSVSVGTSVCVLNFHFRGHKVN